MQAELEHAQPENLISGLAAKLRRHALWDALLLFDPPVFAGLYVIGVPLGTAWLGEVHMLVSAALSLFFGALAVLLRYRPAVPSVSAAAQLLDRQAATQDHFLTLASVEPADWPASFLARLRRDAGNF